MPVLAVIFPREGSDPSKWRSYGTTQVTSLHLLDFIEFGTYIVFFFTMKQDLQTFVWPFLNHFQARQCFAVRGVYPLMGSTDEVCMKYLLLTLELQVKKRRPYPVSLNSLLGRNWWAHKGRVYGIKLALNYGRSVGMFDRGDNLWKCDPSVVKIIACDT